MRFVGTQSGSKFLTEMASKIDKWKGWPLARI